MMDRNLLIPNRRGKIRVGVNGLNFPIFSGRSDLPKATKSTRQASIHLEDELSYLERYKLSEGELLTDVTTEQYLYGILDKVYANGIVLETDNWSNWSSSGDPDFSQDSLIYRINPWSVKFTATTSAQGIFYNPATLDLSSADYMEFFLYVEDLGNMDFIEILFFDGTNYSTILYTDFVSNGWGHYRIPMEYLSGNADLSNLDYIGVTYASQSGSVELRMADWRFVNSLEYPLRRFDTSLQTIPVAWWAGNTALYEIKTAVEAEGGRFFSDNNGVLNFWNRQHFQVNNEFQSVKHGFTFNRMFDLEYPADMGNVINSVVVKIDPLKIAPEEDIWKYPEVMQLTAGQSRVVWAEYQHPTPLSSIVTPVATTDFTANDAEDGTGTDRTASISIENITKFTTSSKITIKNNHTGTVYVTLFKLRGTPAKKVSEIENIASSQTTIRVQNETSISKYGEMPSGGLEIENKYLANYQDGEFLANFLVDTYNEPLTRVELKARSFPTLDIGDPVSVHDEDLNKNKIMRVVGVKDSFSSDGLNQSIIAREITLSEQFTYFTVGSSEIGGNDKIAP